MKKFVVFCVSFALLFFAAVASAENNPDTVIQMTYIVKLPDVIREGKYTGEVKDGIPHGYGLFEATNSDGINWHYIGTWDNGNMTGEGGQYWNDGSCTIGTYENGNMLSGHIYSFPSKHVQIDFVLNNHGCIDVIEYHSDGSVLFDGCIHADTGLYHQGTVYTKDGKVFFKGEIGEGFNWNLVYVD